MNLLTRTEELILLAVWRLRDKAYSVHIRNRLMEATGQFWSFGAVYMPLERLEKKGYLTSYLADPTSERGGRSKRIYTHTPEGLKALTEIRKVNSAMWDGVPEVFPEELS
jgi:DNA-binding PadR family transcriptional regulator